MATVEYQGVPTVQAREDVPDDYQHIEATPNEFGAQIGQATEQLGGGALDAAKFYGTVAADNGTNNTLQQVNNLLYGDPSKTVAGPDGKPVQDTGYFGLRGADAMAKRGEVQEEIDRLIAENREGLSTPLAQYQYNVDTRRYRAGWQRDIGSHADQQQKVWATDTNNTSAQLALNAAGRDPNNPDAAAQAQAIVRKSFVRNAQLAGEDAGGAVLKADQEVALARIRALAAGDPSGAQKLLQDNSGLLASRPEYDSIAYRLKAEADQQDGLTAGARAIAGAAGAPASTPGGLPTPQALHGALISQESGGNPNVPTSVNGAVGPGQILPATFQQYAKPGEDIHNPVDNLAVSQRITNDLYQKYNGDASRVAVAYFSGPGNVAPEGSPTPWINDVKDGNGKSVSSYVSDIQSRLSTSGNAGSPQALKAGAYQRVMEDQSLSPQAKEHALTYINQQYTAAEVAAEADTRAKTQANETAANSYVSEALKGAGPDIVTRIANDPHLTAETKENLYSFVTAKTGDDPAQYGPAYTKAYNAILAPAGDPSRITDINTILKMGAPGGGLTDKGVDRLSRVLAASRKSVSEAGVEMAKNGLLNYARSKLTFTDDIQVPGLPPRKDVKGEAIFNAQFIPKFEAGYDNWVAAGKDPMQYLTQKNVDSLMDGMRSPTEMAQDRIIAIGEAPAQPQEDPNAPLPVAPKGVNADEWDQIVAAPPPLAGGGTWSRAAWAQVLQRLAADPKGASPWFDHYFGKVGYKASDFVGRLTSKPAPAPAVDPYLSAPMVLP